MDIYSHRVSIYPVAFVNDESLKPFQSNHQSVKSRRRFIKSLGTFATAAGWLHASIDKLVWYRIWNLHFSSTCLTIDDHPERNHSTQLDQICRNNSKSVRKVDLPHVVYKWALVPALVAATNRIKGVKSGLFRFLGVSLLASLMTRWWLFRACNSAAQTNTPVGNGQSQNCDCCTAHKCCCCCCVGKCDQSPNKCTCKSAKPHQTPGQNISQQSECGNCLSWSE